MASIATMSSPCDKVVIRSGGGAVSPCLPAAGKWVLAATIIGSSMAFIDSTVVNVALPALQAEFHATVVNVQWIVESYGLFLGALILVGGSLGDRLGRRLVFLVGVMIFALASAACGFASNIHMLILARTIQGIGAALLVPGSLSIISASFGEKNRGQAIGTWSGFTAITTAVGPLLGGWLVQHASWRWVFFINLPLAAAVVVISLWRVPESRSPDQAGIDWWGALVVTLGLGGLVFGFIESVNLGWRNPIVIATLVGGCIGLAFSLFIESRVQSPMAPLLLFVSSSFSGANLLTLFLYAAIGIFFFLFPLNLIQVQQYSPTATGAAVLPLIMLIFLLSRWSGGLVARYGPRLPLIAGPLIVALGFALFAIPSVGGSYWKNFFPAVMILGFGMAITVAPLTTVVMNSVGEEHVGAASGINNAVARVAGVLAIAVLGIVMVKAFAVHLDRVLDPYALPAGVAQTIQANQTKLGGLPIPADLAPQMKTAVKGWIDQSFIFGFRFVMLICAGLAVVSAVVAAVMVQSASGTA